MPLLLAVALFTVPAAAMLGLIMGLTNWTQDPGPSRPVLGPPIAKEESLRTTSPSPAPSSSSASRTVRESPPLLPPPDSQPLPPPPPTQPEAPPQAPQIPPPHESRAWSPPPGPPSEPPSPSPPPLPSLSRSSPPSPPSPDPCLTGSLPEVVACLSQDRLLISQDRLRELVRTELERGTHTRGLTPTETACSLIGRPTSCPRSDVFTIEPYVAEWLEEQTEKPEDPPRPAPSAQHPKSPRPLSRRSLQRAYPRKHLLISPPCPCLPPLTRKS